MSWTGTGRGYASWSGNQGPQLSVGNIPTTQPTSNPPTLTIKGGNTVDIPLQYWSYYEASNSIYIRDTTGGCNGDIQNIGGDLYWNSNLIGLASNIPDIGDWSFYPALTDVDIDNHSLLNCCNIFASTIYASTISTVGIRARDISVSTLRGVNGFLSSANISSLFADRATASTVNASTVITSTLQLENIGVGILSTDSPAKNLLWNGAIVNTNANTCNIADWSKYPIITGCNVAASGNNQTNIGNGNGSVQIDGGSISMISDRTISLSNDRGADVLGPATVSIYTTDGTYGEIKLTADSGFPIDPLTDAGGYIELKANSALSGTTPLALSRINQEAATLTLNAGAAGALAYVPGSVNILSGLGTGVQILTGTGVINIASGQALTLAAAQAVAINGGAGGVRMTNTSGSKLQSDWLLPYESNYTFISSFTNEYGYSKQLEASTLTVYEELDVPKNAFITNATINRIFGPGPDLPITNTGGIELQVAPGNRIQCYEVDLSGTPINAARFQAGAMFASSLNTLGNIGSCNFVVGAGGSFGTLQASNISTTTWTGVDGGYISSMTNQDWLLLNSLSTQNVYAQIGFETDGAVLAPSVFADLMTSSNIITSNIDLISLNGVPINSPIFANPSYSTITVKENAFMSTVQATGRIVTAATGFIASGSTITAVKNITAGTFLQAPAVSTNIISTATVNSATTTATTLIRTPALSTTQISTAAILASTINGYQYPAPIYAQFSSSNTQTVSAANTPTALTYTNTDLTVGGITFSGSQITVPATGNYSIITSIQFDKTSLGTDYANFWFRINGTDVPRSATRIAVAGINGETVGTVEILASITSGQSIQLFIASADATMAATAFPAQTSPYAHPAIPSVIITVKRLLT